MSLAIEYQGKKVRFKLHISKRRMLSFAGIALFLSLAIVQPWQGLSFDSLVQKERVLQEQRATAMQSELVQEVRERTQRELTAMAMKVGELQAQIMRLEALGQRLVAEAQLEHSDFDFTSPLPIGGPDQPLPEWPLLSDHPLLSELDGILEKLEIRQKQLRLLESVMLHHHIEEERFIAGRPVNEGWLSSQFGVRRDPFNGNPTMHRGVDFAAPEGTPIHATGAGIVTFAGPRAGYGNLIEIDHGGGLRTRYGHMKSIDVRVGDVVTRGQVIASVGNLGRSTGPHVHYEVLENGRQVNPSKYVFREAPGE